MHRNLKPFLLGLYSRNGRIRTAPAQKGNPSPIHAGRKLKDFAIPINPEMRCISGVVAPGARPPVGGVEGTPTPPAAPAPAPSPATEGV